MFRELFSKSKRLGKRLMEEIGRNAHVKSPPRLDEARRLLDAGADVNYHDRFESVLSKAGRSPWCSPAVVQLLLERGADVNGSQCPGLIPPLVRAAHRSDNERIRLLVDAGADLNIQFDSRSVLTEITPWGDLEIVRYLLVHGADPNFGCFNGFKPIHIATLWGRADLASLYIEYGADVSAHDKYGFTPIALALNRGVSKRYTGTPEAYFDAFIQLLREVGAEE